MQQLCRNLHVQACTCACWMSGTDHLLANFPGELKGKRIQEVLRLSPLQGHLDALPTYSYIYYKAARIFDPNYLQSLTTLVITLQSRHLKTTSLHCYGQSREDSLPNVLV